MKRSAKVCWVGFVFSTIVIAAVAGLVIYFTAFKKTIADNSSQPYGTTSAESTSSDGAVGGGSTVNSLADHFSHSVPGFEYRVVDYDGDGKEEVTLDGSRSHTHYYDAGPPVIIGKLVEMTWFDKESKKTLATVAKPTLNFPVGTTIVGLTVADDFRDSHTDYATVIVEKPIVDGSYCYYYPAPESGDLDLPSDLKEGTRPTYAKATKTIDFEDDSAFPSGLRGSKFQMRCVFIVSGSDESSINFKLDHYGPVQMYINNGDEDILILESDDKSESTSEGTASLADGDNVIQIVYSRTSSSAGKLVLKEGGDNISYDMSKVLPIITSIDPTTSTLEGGGTAKITGIGLLNNLKITFGSKEITPDKGKSSDTEVVVDVPGVSTSTIADISATNAAGSSNTVQFQYSTSGKAPIKFKEDRIMYNGKSLEISLITGIKYGPDHRVYASAVNHRVHSFAVNSKMQASDVCVSPILGEHKSILGLAFNPADSDADDITLYVSASILHWKRDNKLNHPLAWANGEILKIKKNINGNCLDVYGEPVISGLPVSNHDHGVNGLVFDDDGNLHFQVGGFTNAGVNNAGSLLGGIAENPFSGASIIAPILKPGFNGKITYTSTNPEEATVAGGDVKVYSAGWRNSFGIAKHSNGYLYGTDNGASTGFGDMSRGCNKDEQLIGENLADKLGKIIEGKYAGHPNRNRGRQDSKQCEFRGPDEISDDYFEAPIATFESSTDGVIEYTANTFGGQMKGDLLCTKYSTQESPGEVFRVRLDSNGNANGKPDKLWAASGLSVEMSPWGHLMMPRVYKKEIMALTPLTHSSGKVTFTAVLPFRGPKEGGNKVIVTGENLAKGTVATFDGKSCTDVEEIEEGISFYCKVPAGNGGKGVGVGLVLPDGTKVGPNSGVDYQYMKI